jgi:hypothetical protein
LSEKKNIRRWIKGINLEGEQKYKNQGDRRRKAYEVVKITYRKG